MFAKNHEIEFLRSIIHGAAIFLPLEYTRGKFVNR